MQQSSEARGFGRKMGRILLATAIFLGVAEGTLAEPREKVVKIVTQIQRADYEGNREALQRLFDELLPFVTDTQIGSRVRYWRGFAVWRKAINGFNDNASTKELQQDLQNAVNEFKGAIMLDPSFVDAKVGESSCIGMLAYALTKENPEGQQDKIAIARRLIREAQEAEPDNPRLQWVLGLNLWYTPPEHGGGQAKSIETYEKGLATIRKQRTMAADPLDPSWGEPELMMSLAWCQLHRTNQDVNAAERYAQSALEIVPYWHYVRDILMPQIQEAKKGRVAQSTFFPNQSFLAESSAGDFH